MINELVAQAGTPKKKQSSLKGANEVDRLLIEMIEKLNCPVPIRKLGDGYYYFGSRKIYAKIMNGKLVIRVGGGYMVIEEFIEAYAEQEMQRLEKLDPHGVDPFDEDADLSLCMASPSKCFTVILERNQSPNPVGRSSSPRSSDLKKSTSGGNFGTLMNQRATVE